MCFFLGGVNQYFNKKKKKQKKIIVYGPLVSVLNICCGSKTLTGCLKIRRLMGPKKNQCMEITVGAALNS